jgi:hypothetical protein
VACDVNELLLQLAVPFSFLGVCTFGLDGEPLQSAHSGHVRPYTHPAENLAGRIGRKLRLEIVNDLRGVASGKRKCRKKWIHTSR